MDEIYKFVIILSFVCFSCNDDVLDGVYQTNTELSDCYKPTIDDINNVIANFKSHTETRSSHYTITNISSFRNTDMTRTSDGCCIDDVIYAVNVDSTETFFIAGDKRANAVYAVVNGNLSFDNNAISKDAPNGFLLMLENAITDIKMKSRYKSVVNPDWVTSVEIRQFGHGWVFSQPKCEVEWDQKEPFNNMCPLYKDDKCKYVKSAAGCVPIAAMQVLTYLWDHNNNEFNGYKLRSSWDRICKRWSSHLFVTNSDEAIDVANLSINIGRSIGTKYGKESATINVDVVADLIKKQSNGKIDYTVSTKLSDVRQNLTMNGITILEAYAKRLHPTLFRRTTYQEGHAMIIDGEMMIGDRNEMNFYFHINYGWGPMYNGYFLNSTVIPDGHEDTQWMETKDVYPYHNRFFNFQKIP